MDHKFAGHLNLEKLSKHRDALTDALFQMSPAGNALGVVGGVGRGAGGL